MTEKAFLTAAPIYMHFRQTRPSNLSEDEDDQSDYLLREFHGDRYTARLTETIVETAVGLQKDLHEAIRIELTKLRKRAEESESTEENILVENFDVSKIVDKLSLGRLDDESVKREIEAWRDKACEQSIDEVIEHIEDYLTGQADIPKQPMSRVRILYASPEPSAVMTRLKSELGDSSGAILATGEKWYHEQTNGLDMNDDFPIVTIGIAPEYEQREHIREKISDAKDRSNYTPPKIVTPTDINN